MARVGDVANSGLRVANARVARSAHNLANVNTDGFKAERVIARDQNPGVTYSSVPTEAPAPLYDRDGTMVEGSNTDVANEMVEQMGAANAFKANLAVIKTDAEMQDALLDLKA